MKPFMSPRFTISEYYHRDRARFYRAIQAVRETDLVELCDQALEDLRQSCDTACDMARGTAQRNDATAD